MFPAADMFPIQLVLMKLVLSGYWSRKNRHKCLMVIKDILRRKASDTQCVFLSGEKCLYQAGRSQWLRMQWIVWVSNDALGLWGEAGGDWRANCKDTRGEESWFWWRMRGVTRQLGKSRLSQYHSHAAWSWQRHLPVLTWELFLEYW